MLFLATLAILMVPYAPLLIPLYVLLNQVGLSNSLVGVALAVVFVVLSLALFSLAIYLAEGWRREALRATGVGLLFAGAEAVSAAGACSWAWAAGCGPRCCHRSSASACAS